MTAKTLLFICLFFPFTFLSLAQTPCEVMIPADAELIRRSPLLEQIAKEKTYWICDDSKVIFRDGKGIVMVDRGSKVTLAKGEFVVYLRKGAKLSLGMNVRGTVYVERGAEFLVYSNMQQISCEYLVFDYSQAPKGICPEIKTEIPDIVKNQPAQPYPSYPSEEDLANESTQSNPEYSQEDNNQPNTQSSPDYIQSDAHIIPPNANVMQTGVFELRKIGNEATYWICERTNYQHTGNNNVFYVEKGSSFTLYSGSNNIIYLKENIKISLGVGSGNQVFYVGEPNLIQNRSKSTRFTKLTSLDFDYSQAPAEGCK